MAQKYPTLNNAPINEALIQINFRGASDSNTMPKLQEYLKSEFPTEEKLEGIEFGISAGPDGVGSHHKSSHRFRYSSQDKKYVVQYGKDFVCLSRLKPYETWDKFIDKFIGLWEIFIDDVKITEFGAQLRFINEFDLPSDNFYEKLSIGGNIVRTPPTSVHRAFNQFNLLKNGQAEGEQLLADVISYVEAKDSEQVNIIFDIQTSLANSSEYTDIKNLRAKLELLRDFKNELFFVNIPEAERIFS